ncbi:filamentous hemagglutinin N-terminal domain-containing protein [Polaromonas sp.]|uniref:two-partner secretion domain-containing protein n=1 Tax=Polaromonas sp. TaxID=1869339 RepID=UPI003266FBB6
MTFYPAPRVRRHRFSVRTVVVRLSRKLKATYRIRTGPYLSHLLLAVLSLTLPSLARALPQGAVVEAGAATVSSPTASSMVINQTTDKAVLGWQSFSIGQGQSVQFIQPNAASVALNRVMGGDVSSIFGTLSANGQVFLVNPAGVMFAPGAQVNVGGLVASSLNLSNADFMAGKYQFSGAGGSVVNYGNIQGGYVVLAAPNVANHGTISAPGGAVGLLAGSRVSVDPTGGGLVKFSVDAAAVNAVASNTGTITVDGGHAAILVSSLGDTFSTVLNQSGVIRANSISSQNGTIVLDGGASGIVQVSGTLEARGAQAGETGGTVKVLGERVGLMAGANIDASGDAGGGTVLVGGNFQGSGAERNAKVTLVNEGAQIDASATTTGDGGKVIVWADDTTRYHGAISAKGGANSGNGGFVEVSGKNNLVFTGAVDTSAANGALGTVLLDPTNITIVAGAGTNDAEVSDAAVAFADGGAGNFQIGTTAIQNVAGQVVLQASNDVTVNGAINKGNGGLTVMAGNDINVNANITASTAIFLNANYVSTPGGGATGTGKVTVGAGVTLSGANVSLANDFSSTANVVNGALTATGDVNLFSSATLGAAATLNATNLNINAGSTKTVTLGASNAISNTTSVVISNGTTLAMGGFSDTVADVRLQSGTINGTGTLSAPTYTANFGTINANLGTGTLTSTGTVALNGASASTTVNITGGTLTLGANDRLSNGAAVTIASGATLGMGAFTDTVNALTLNGGTLGGTGTLTVASAATLNGGTLNANLAGTVPLTQASGTTTLNGTAAFTTVNVNAGTLALGATSNRLTGGNAAITIASGATLDTGSATQALGAGSATIVNNGALITGAAITAATIAGTGTASLGGNVSMGGPQTYGAVTLTTGVGMSGNNITFNGAVSGPHALIVNAGGVGTTVFNGAVNIASLQHITGSGTLSLKNVTTSGSQQYSGNVTLDGSYATTNNAFSVGGTTTLAGSSTVSAGTGAISFGSTLAGTVGAESLTTSNTGALTFGGAISNLNNLTIAGGPTAVALPTTTLTGTLDVTSAGTIGQTGAVSAALVRGTTTAQFNLNNAGNSIGSLGTISASGVSVKDASGGLALTGPITATTGSISIETSGGALAIGGNALQSGGNTSLTALGVTGDITSAAGGTVTATGGFIDMSAGRNIALGAAVSANGAANPVELRVGVSTDGAFSTTAAISSTGGTTIRGAGSNDSFDFSNAPAFNATVDGAAGTNTLTGRNAAATYTLTAVGAGNGDGLTFTNIGALVGGSANDTFTLASGAAFGGTIAGGGGTNTMGATDGANTWAITGANSGTLNAGTAFSAITNLAGGTGVDTLAARNVDTTFNMTGPNAVTAEGMNGTSMEALLGGSANDTFTLAAGVTSFNGSVAGSGGTNTLAAVDGTNAWVMSGTNSGTLNASTSFNTITTLAGGTGTDTLTGQNTGTVWTVTGANDVAVYGVNGTSMNALVGGTNTDIFALNAGVTFNGSIAGGGGAGTLSTPSGTNAWTITGPNAGTFNTNTVFSGITALTGGTGADTLQGRNAATAWNITGANTVTVEGMSATSMNALVGGTANDTFTLPSGLPSFNGSVAGGGGTDTLVATNGTNAWSITGANAGTLNTTTTFSAITNLTGGSGTDTLTGRNNATAWSVTGINAATVEGLNATSIEALVGGTLNDTFTLAAATPTFNGAIAGGGGTDTLATTDGANAWAITGANSGTLNTSTGLSAIANLAGGAGADTFTFADAGSVVGTVAGGGTASIDTVNLSAKTGLVAINTQTGVVTGSAGTSGIEAFIGNGVNTTLTSAAFSLTGANSGVADAGIAYSAVANLQGAAVAGTIAGNGGSVTGTITDGGAGTTLSGALTSGGAQTYNGAVTLGANTTLAAASVNLNGTVSGATQALTINSSGVTTLGGAVNVASLMTDAAGSTSIGANITTSGAQNLGDAVTLTADVVLASSGGGALNLGSTVNGAQALTLNTTGATTLGGVVGGTTALTSLTTNAGGTTSLGGSVTTTGLQSFGDNVTATGPVTVASTGGGNISFLGTLGAGVTITTTGTIIRPVVPTPTPVVPVSANLAGPDLRLAANIALAGGDVSDGMPNSLDEKVLPGSNALLRWSLADLRKMMSPLNFGPGTIRRATCSGEQSAAGACQ